MHKITFACTLDTRIALKCSFHRHTRSVDGNYSILLIYIATPSRQSTVPTILAGWKIIVINKSNVGGGSENDPTIISRKKTEKWFFSFSWLSRCCYGFSHWHKFTAHRTNWIFVRFCPNCYWRDPLRLFNGLIKRLRFPNKKKQNKTVYVCHLHVESENLRCCFVHND